MGLPSRCSRLLLVDATFWFCDDWRMMGLSSGGLSAKPRFDGAWWKLSGMGVFSNKLQHRELDSTLHLVLPVHMCHGNVSIVFLHTVQSWHDTRKGNPMITSYRHRNRYQLLFGQYPVQSSELPIQFKLHNSRPPKSVRRLNLSMFNMFNITISSRCTLCFEAITTPFDTVAGLDSYEEAF